MEGLPLCFFSHLPPLMMRLEIGYDKMSNARTFYFWIGSFLSFHEKENICVVFIYNKYTFVGLVAF
jgi:hypothetical protein